MAMGGTNVGTNVGTEEDTRSKWYVRYMQVPRAEVEIQSSGKGSCFMHVFQCLFHISAECTCTRTYACVTGVTNVGTLNNPLCVLYLVLIVMGKSSALSTKGPELKPRPNINK